MNIVEWLESCGEQACRAQGPDVAEVRKALGDDVAKAVAHSDAQALAAFAGVSVSMTCIIMPADNDEPLDDQDGGDDDSGEPGVQAA